MKRLGFYFKTGFLTAVALGGVVSIGIPVWKEFKTSFAYRDFQQYGVIGTYKHRFFGVFGKMHEIESLDRENQELNQRVAILEKKFELERARNASAEMKEITQELSDRIRNEGGNELARVLASIPYQIPTHLLPHQQYALALGYFRKGEYEQAAVLFNHLLNLQDDTSYQRGEVQLLSAISWYHLKNYKLTRHFLRTVAKGANPQTSLYRTAILWEAILAKAEGRKGEAQRRLTAALAQFPHSAEAAWINRGKGAKAARIVAGRSEREPNQSWMRQQELKNEKERTVEAHAPAAGAGHAEGAQAGHAAPAHGAARDADGHGVHDDSHGEKNHE